MSGVGVEFVGSSQPLGTEFHVGTEFQVNTHTTSDQRQPAVDLGWDGNFVVVWQSPSQDGSTLGVFGQLFNGGAKAGGEFQVNVYTTSFQSDADVSFGSDGSFLVVWESRSQDGSDEGIFGRIFDSSGAPASTEDFQINTYTTERQDNPRVGADAGGNFVVTWRDLSRMGGEDSGVFAQRLSSLGQPLGSQFQINTFTTGYRDHPGIAVAPQGQFVITWHSYRQDGSADGVFARRFLACLIDCTPCDDGDPATKNDRCRNGMCIGNAGPEMFGNVTRSYSLLGVDTTSVTATASSLVSVAGHVCARRTVMGTGTTVGGKVIATRTSGNAASFTGGNTVGAGIFTGGGTVNPGSPAVVNPGGTLIAPANKAVNQLNQCMNVANQVMAAAEVIGDPLVACPTDAFPANVNVPDNGMQTIDVTPGVLNVIQLTNLELGIKGQLLIKSGMANMNTGVVINVSGLFRLRRAARIRAAAGVMPNQILINVSGMGGTATLDRDSRLEGTLMALDRDIATGMNVMTAGGLFGGETSIGVGPNSSIGNNTYRGPLP